MTDDFVTRLRLQLREAAEREERKHRPPSRLTVARPRLPRLAPERVLTALVVALIVIAALYMLATLRPEPAAPPPWKVVTRLAPGGSLGAIAGGFGSAWVDDTTRQQLLRIDARSHTITARIAVRGDASVSIGDGAVWVVESTGSGYELTGPLLRIDPRTDRVVARIALRTPDGHPFSAWDARPDHGVVWIIGPHGALRLDPRTNQITKAIALGSGYEITDSALTGSELWLLRADRRLLGFDAQTGTRTHTLRLPGTGGLQTGELRTVGDALMVLADNEGADDIVRVDATTGHTMWHKRLTRVGPSTAAAGALWVPIADADRTGTDVIGLDPRTGETREHVRVGGEFNATAFDRVGSELWLTTAGGRAIVISR